MPVVFFQYKQLFSNGMKKNVTKIKFLLQIAAFGLLVFHSNNVFSQENDTADRKSYLTKVQISETDKIKVFNNLWETVNRLYFDRTFNGTNWVKLREIYLSRAVAAKDKIELVGVLNKMLGEIKTSHLFASFEVGVSGKTLEKFFGKKIDYSQNDIIFDYGFSTVKFGEQLVVTKVERGSSADEAGIKPGWIVKSFTAVPQSKKDGEFLIHTETANYIFLTETGEEKKLILAKSFYPKPRSAAERVSKILDDGILYLKFNSFDDNTGKWIKRKITGNSSAKAVIIDLRGNRGGLVAEVKETLSIFFPVKTVIGNFIERDLDEKTFRVGSDEFFKGPVIILIDGNSASGAELLASAFQESGRGKIIGQKSAGEVLYGITKSVSNGLNLYVAVRDYKTAKGDRLEGKGVAPDIEVPLILKDFRRHYDATLEKALEILKNQ